MIKRGISSLELVFLEEYIMKQVNCPICGSKCVKNGKLKSGNQRWLCKSCKNVFTPKIDNDTKQLQQFLAWLFSKEVQSNMSGGGRTFRRKTSKFWDIWVMSPKIEESKDVLYLDGIYLSRKSCILICCDKDYVLGWYLCRYEHSGAWEALMSRIAEPKVVVSDGGTGFRKALKRKWPKAKHQRCVFHVFSQVKRYTTSRPNTLAGLELYALARDLFEVKSIEDSKIWVDRFTAWIVKHKRFLSEVTYDENGKSRPKHERLIKAEKSIIRLLNDNTLFTYLDKELRAEFKIPSTNNRIEGGVNACLREMLHNHRGLSVETRIKAVFWWCYMHSPKPLSASEILKTMPTNKSIDDIYKKMTAKKQLENTIPMWGDAVVWSELHHSSNYPVYWD